MNKLKKIVEATAGEVAKRAASLVIKTLQSQLENQETVSLFLSGGKTPKLLHRELVKRKHDLEWNRVRFFFGDERCVEPEHPRSNFRLAKETLFDKLNIPETQIFRMEGELSPPTAAENYENILKDVPVFDIVLLGLGHDGHTASLFPGSPVLAEDQRLVRPAQATDGEMRITLTPYGLSKARQIFFLITGKDKSEALFELFAPEVPHPHPARTILDQAQDATVAFDRAAGSLILNLNQVSG